MLRLTLCSFVHEQLRQFCLKQAGQAYTSHLTIAARVDRLQLATCTAVCSTRQPAVGARAWHALEMHAAPDRCLFVVCVVCWLFAPGAEDRQG